MATTTPHTSDEPEAGDKIEAALERHRNHDLPETVGKITHTIVNSEYVPDAVRITVLGKLHQREWKAIESPTDEDEMRNADNVMLEFRTMLYEVKTILRNSLSKEQYQSILTELQESGVGKMFSINSLEVLPYRAEEQVQQPEQQSAAATIEELLVEAVEEPSRGEFTPGEIESLFKLHGRNNKESLDTLERALILLLMGKKAMSVYQQSIAHIEEHLDGDRKKEIGLLASHLRQRKDRFEEIEQSKEPNKYLLFGYALMARDLSGYLEDEITKIRAGFALALAA